MTKASDSKFSKFVDKAFWAMLLAVASYAAREIHDMTDSIQELNKNMAVVLFSLGVQKDELTRHEVRLDKLEGKEIQDGN